MEKRKTVRIDSNSLDRKTRDRFRSHSMAQYETGAVTPSLEICWPLHDGADPSSHHDGEVWACDVSSDMFYMVTAGGGDGKVILSDQDSNVLKIWEQNTHVDGVAIAHVGRGENIIFNSQRLMHKIKFLKVYGSPKDISMSEESEMDVEIERPSRCRASGHWLAVCNEPDKASIIDIERQTIFRTLLGHSKPVTRVEWCPGSTSKLITASEDRWCYIWDNKDPNPIAKLGPLEGWVYSCALTCNGRFALGATFQGQMTVWDLRKNQQMYIDEAHFPEAVQNIVTVPEEYNKRESIIKCITSGNDGKLKLWTLDLSLAPEEGIDSVEFDIHTSWVNDTRLFADAKRLMTCGHDGRAVCWDLPKHHQGITLPLFVDPEPLRHEN